MRVRFVTTLPRGGPIDHTRSLAAAMAAEGVDVDVVCADRAVAGSFQAVGIDAHLIPISRTWDAWGALKVWHHVRGADVVHAQDRRAGLWVRLAPRPRRAGLRVYTIHGLPDAYLPPPIGRVRPGARASLAYRGVDVALSRRADAVIVPSHAVAQLLTTSIGFPEEKIAVIPGGVDVPDVPLEQPAKTLVGTVAMLEPVKGLPVFLRAAAGVAAERPDVRFGIFGSGSRAADLHALAAELGIGDRVEFAGFVPKREALERITIFVLSSYMENCPMALLEAMASGIPAVATRVGGVPEIALDGEVDLVDPGDDAALAGAVVRLLDHPDLRARQAGAARERVQQEFTAGQAARRTVALYERLLEGG